MLEIHADRTALLLIDFQNDIASHGGKLAPGDDAALARFTAAIANARRSADAARAGSIPVLHVAVGRAPGAAAFNPHAPMAVFAAREDALIEGTPGFGFVPLLAPQPGEPVFVKRGVSALVGTGLPAWLTARGVNTLVLAGLVSHWAIEGTARHASDLGYRAIALRDACGSGGQQRHDTAMENIQVIGTVTDTDRFCEAALRPSGA